MHNFPKLCSVWKRRSREFKWFAQVSGTVFLTSILVLWCCFGLPPAPVKKHKKRKQVGLKYIWSVLGTGLPSKRPPLFHTQLVGYRLSLLICFFSITFCFQRLTFNLKIVYLSVRWGWGDPSLKLLRTDYDTIKNWVFLCFLFSCRIPWFIILVSVYLPPGM